VRRDSLGPRPLHRPVAIRSHSFTVAGTSPGYGRGVAPNASQIRGAQGERCALAHYERLGFRLIERNHRARFGEIDLIVADATTLVFVEVKTRLAGGLDPLLSLTPSKRRRVRRLAAAWLANHPDRPRAPAVRIDAVAVVLDGGGALVSLEQFEDVA